MKIKNNKNKINNNRKNNNKSKKNIQRRCIKNTKLIPISLGHNCSVQLALNKIINEYKLNYYYVTILSWCKSLSMDNVCSLIENNFGDLTKYENWKGNTNIKYKLDYIHDTEIININQEDFEKSKFVESLNRKIDRFQDLINSDNIFYVRADKNPSYENIMRLYNALHLNEKKSFLIIVHETLNLSKEQETNLPKNIFFIQFNFTSFKGTQLGKGKIIDNLSNLIKNKLKPYL
jgi:hypothetical protein